MPTIDKLLQTKRLLFRKTIVDPDLQKVDPASTLSLKFQNTYQNNYTKNVKDNSVSLISKFLNILGIAYYSFYNAYAKSFHEKGAFSYGAANKSNLGETDMAQRRILRAIPFQQKDRFLDM